MGAQHVPERHDVAIVGGYNRLSGKDVRVEEHSPGCLKTLLHFSACDRERMLVRDNDCCLVAEALPEDRVNCGE